MSLLSILATSFSSYLFASLSLLYYPNILHKPKKIKKCTHISHRGGAGEAYENTLSAFNRALDYGTEMLELDCHLTKDKHVVVVHDSCLLRLTGESLKVEECDYAELPPLKTTLNIDFDRENSFSGSPDLSVRKIPLLEDVFKAFPSTQINIDVKNGSDTLIKNINDLVVKYNREGITVWGSFREDISMRCYEQNPAIGRFFSLRGTLRLYFLFYTGLLPFVTLNETHLEIPLYRRKTENLSRTARLFAYVSYTFLARPILFKHLEKRGIPTYAWVLNSEEEFERAFRLGACGVMTDYPSKLAKFLESKHHS